MKWKNICPRGVRHGRKGIADRKRKGRLLLIELLKFLDAAKGDQVNDRLIHPHHECWRNDKFTVFVIDLVRCLSHRMGTTQPNELVGTVQGRMPVILLKEDEEEWLNPDLTEPDHLLPLLKQYPAEEMETWRVGDGAKNARNDSAELIKPLIN
jgi:hypothetical protein